MSFKDNFKRICAENGTNMTTVVKQVKGSSAFTTAINNGSLPKEGELLEFAKILHCSVKDFFADEDNNEITAPDNEDEIDILMIYRSLSRRNRHEFMTMVYEFENRAKVTGGKDD